MPAPPPSISWHRGTVLGAQFRIIGFGGSGWLREGGIWVKGRGFRELGLEIGVLGVGFIGRVHWVCKFQS